MVWCGVYKVRINIVDPMQWLKLYVDLEVHAIGPHTSTPIHENNGLRNGDCDVVLVSLHI